MTEPEVTEPKSSVEKRASGRRGGGRGIEREFIGKVAHVFSDEVTPDVISAGARPGSPTLDSGKTLAPEPPASLQQ